MHKILVVDDEQAVRSAILLVLQSTGNKTLGAENGKKALESAKTFQPDLIIIDLNMPIMDGFQAVRQLIADNFPGEILVLTAYNAHSVKGLKDLGIKHYLRKPINLQQIPSIVESIFDSNNP